MGVTEFSDARILRCFAIIGFWVCGFLGFWDFGILGSWDFGKAARTLGLSCLLVWPGCPVEVARSYPVVSDWTAKSTLGASRRIMGVIDLKTIQNLIFGVLERFGFGSYRI